jgi:pimeloyl-ACP methyl ester carboxylesterase
VAGPNPVPSPGSPASDPDVYLKVAPSGTYPGFDQCFANGVPADQAAVLAATQRPSALSAGSDPSGVPAWKTIPSWAVVGTADHVIPLAEQLFMAHRADAHITEINSGHLSLITHPRAVTQAIIAAANTVGCPPRPARGPGPPARRDLGPAGPRMSPARPTARPAKRRELP